MTKRNSTSTASGRPASLWTPTFVMLAIALLGVGFTFYLLVPTMAGYAVAKYGASATEAGLASSSFFFGAVAARALAGRALVRFGTRSVVLGSVVWLLVSCASYLLPVGLAGLIVLRIIHGVGFGFAATALVSAAMAMIPPTRRAEGSGWFLMGMTLATGFAPFVALVLVNSSVGQTGVFWLSLGCAALAVGCVAAVARSLPGRPANPPPTVRGLGGLIDRKAVPIGLVIGACAFAYALVLAYLNLHAGQRNLIEAAGLYFLVYAIVIMVSRPVAGMLQDRYNDDVVTIPLLLTFAVGLVITAVATHPVALLVGAALVGLGYGTMLSGGQAMAVHKVGHARTGLGVSTYWLVVDLATGVGPIVLGALIVPLGYQNTFIAAAVLPIGALVFYLLVARRVRPAEPESI
ncbi:MFS transporter [Ammonicoccus fulvus]|uniref:MFS transporter n=1 Tax=Ammonicoccus fulvus TaxID=3138240 RepID=A0ABZ3FQ98_9ACTN